MSGHLPCSKNEWATPQSQQPTYPDIRIHICLSRQKLYRGPNPNGRKGRGSPRKIFPSPLPFLWEHRGGHAWNPYQLSFFVETACLVARLNGGDQNGQINSPQNPNPKGSDQEKEPGRRRAMGAWVGSFGTRNHRTPQDPIYRTP